jgi:HD-GYP domain-containing protein (c-di-GMP phosphodiesterase class II)
MKNHPLFYLRPVFDTSVDNIKALLSSRFDFQPFHRDTLEDMLKHAEAPWLVLADADTYRWLLTHYSAAPFHCFLYLEADEKPDSQWLSNPSLLDFSYGIPNTERLLFALNRIYSQLVQHREMSTLTHEVNVQKDRLNELNKIGVALSTERDLDRLLDKILTSSMEITQSDSGSLYLVEETDNTQNNDRHLRFKWARNQSLDIDFSEFTIPLNEQSIAGTVALRGNALNIQDVHHLDTDVPYGFNKSFDENTHYRSKSMLTVPMKNPKGEVIGILQMINKKRSYEEALHLGDEKALNKQILFYTSENEELLSSLASQAAVAIENTRLYDSIQALFEGFIKASVKAIESRDPTTSGHSERVAVLTVGLAQSVDRADSERYQSVHFSRSELREIKYASLLHDFGKIGVRENVLVKADKLYPHELESIKYRFQLIRKHLESQFYLKQMELHSQQASESELTQIKAQYHLQLQDLEADLHAVLEANRPSILASEVSERLTIIQEKSYAVDEEQVVLLNPYEFGQLSIMKGTLSIEERKEIESHVTHTYHFLQQIPWTKSLRQVPNIAYAHHEKLNGRGYPRNLPAEDIPIQARMMSIADIYDALTASDRPYKKALPVQRALDILGYEVKDGMLDADLYQVFLDTKVYEKIGGEASHQPH